MSLEIEEIEEIVSNVFNFDSPITLTYEATANWIAKLSKNEIEEIVTKVFKLVPPKANFIDELDAVVNNVSKLDAFQRNDLITNAPEVTADWLIELNTEVFMLDSAKTID